MIHLTHVEWEGIVVMDMRNVRVVVMVMGHLRVGIVSAAGRYHWIATSPLITAVELTSSIKRSAQWS